MEDSVGTDCKSRGWDGQTMAKGKNWDNSNIVTIKND